LVIWVTSKVTRLGVREFSFISKVKQLAS
jgi:hypothetical protein